MAKALLLVESKPATPDLAEEYHRWHEQTHLPEMLDVAGFASARRYQAVDGESFLTLYEIDGRRDGPYQPQGGSGQWADVAAVGRPHRPASRHALLHAR